MRRQTRVTWVHKKWAELDRQFHEIEDLGMFVAFRDRLSAIIDEERNPVAVVKPERTVVEPERTRREGDSQPMPTVNDSPDIQSMVIADIEARRELGIKRYGTALQAFNGREALVDAYEEAMDLAMYLKQAIVETNSGTGSCGVYGCREPRYSEVEFSDGLTTNVYRMSLCSTHYSVAASGAARGFSINLPRTTP